ncbi:MAG: hypothetical protein J6R49_06630 [Clostridia bacterium]|nr:hypothetical protein [Clostridia bacterium]
MKIAVIGGDARMLAAAKLFRKSGLECAVSALGDGSRTVSEALRGADVAVLPLPCEKNGFLNTPLSEEKITLAELFGNAEEKTLFIGGITEQKSERTVDYAIREDFLLSNAIITAESAIKLALCERRATLFGARATVVGFGRIGSLLTRMLNALGASVNVVARRSESLISAKISGASPFSFEDIGTACRGADLIFNTVPKTVIGGEVLSELGKDCLIIDLASGEGGCDKKAADSLRVRLIHALALPGKHFPESAGRAVFESVCAILRERGLAK